MLVSPISVRDGPTNRVFEAGLRFPNLIHARFVAYWYVSLIRRHRLATGYRPHSSENSKPQNPVCILRQIWENIAISSNNHRSLGQCTFLKSVNFSKNIETHTAHTIVSWPNPSHISFSEQALISPRILHYKWRRFKFSNDSDCAFRIDPTPIFYSLPQVQREWYQLESRATSVPIDYNLHRHRQKMVNCIDIRKRLYGTDNQLWYQYITVTFAFH